MLEQGKGQRCKGMTLVELIISTGVFSFVVAGSIASALLFAKIAKDHENRALFSTDMRIGMEVMSFDIRNASRVLSRMDTGFRLADAQGGNPVNYTFDEEAGTITRTGGGQSREVFRNVSDFDVLTSAADEPSGNLLAFNRDAISIETLSLSAPRGSGGTSNFSVTNFTVRMRNR